MTTLKIYKPDGVHTKDNPCDCKNCNTFPEFFHAHLYYLNLRWGNYLEDAIHYRNRYHPDGVIMLQTTHGKDSYFIREDGSKVTYNHEEHNWYEEDGTLHSIRTE